MTSNLPAIDRSLALACDRALVGLSPEEELELVALMPPGSRIDGGLELAAASIALSELMIDEPLPRHLAERALQSASSPAPAPTVALRGGGTIPLPGRAARDKSQPVLEPRVSAPAESAARESKVVPIRPPRATSNMLPWFAAAACFGMMVATVAYFGLRERTNGKTPVASASVQPEKLTAARSRERLLAEATDLVRTAWGPTGDAAGKGETGEVVWSNARQEGYMTFRAIAANDPKVSQYQLWIFDAERDERFPVDGGVFDVDASTGEVTIPISAKVAVARPTLFAVTVEKPGGVVVSKRERLVLAAKVAG